MLFDLKKQKGTTIVEVLISVIIIGIVSMYGLSFFSSAYKHAQDSNDYNFILHDLVRKMEMVKGGGYPGEFVVGTDGDYFPQAVSEINLGNNDEEIYDFKVSKVLRENCRVDYTCRVSVDVGMVDGHIENFQNSARVECEATWPWADGEAHSNAAAVLANKNRITLVTYMAEIWNM